jgi:hypothetical protein
MSASTVLRSEVRASRWRRLNSDRARALRYLGWGYPKSQNSVREAIDDWRNSIARVRGTPPLPLP